MDKHRMDMEDTEEMIVPSLWGAHVTEAVPVPLEPHEQRFTLFRATLEKGNKAQLFISIKGSKYALGTLTKDKKEYTKLEIEIFEGTDEVPEISVVGDGTVSLVGAYSPALFNGDEDDFGSLSDFDDDDDEDEPQLLEESKAAKTSPKGLPAGKPASPKGPQPKQTQPKTPNQPKGQQPAAANKPAVPAVAGQPAAAGGAKKPNAKGKPPQKTPPKQAGNKPDSPKPAVEKQSPKKDTTAETESSKTPEKESSTGAIPDLDTKTPEKSDTEEKGEDSGMDEEGDKPETPKPTPQAGNKGKKGGNPQQKTPQPKKAAAKPAAAPANKPAAKPANPKTSPTAKPTTPAAKRAATPGSGGPAKKKSTSHLPGGRYLPPTAVPLRPAAGFRCCACFFCALCGPALFVPRLWLVVLLLARFAPLLPGAPSGVHCLYFVWTAGGVRRRRPRC
jgi:hypothetical protein